MTINELLALNNLTANDQIPVWDAEATGSTEPTAKITAQNFANAVKSLANLIGTGDLDATPTQGSTKAVQSGGAYDAIAQSTAKLQGLTVYNMSKSAGDEETNKPWLVIKRLIESMPIGNVVGRISAGSIYGYYGYKHNNNYASFIVDIYINAIGPYKVVVSNGSWLYASINVGTYTGF